jgi:REP element-mobilizing transposase RayT
MGKKYAITDKEAMYFISFATIGWVDVFSRKEYRDIVIQNLKYCQENKGLIIYSWCIMSNHLHLVAQARDSNLPDILRDFKSYTAKLLLKAIQELPESRREWMIRIF